MLRLRAKWVQQVEEEEGMPFVDVVRREKSFGVPDHVIADSFEIDQRTYHAMIGRIREKGIEI